MKLALVGDLSGTAGPDCMGGTYDVASLASALARRGHDVRIHTASQNTSEATLGEIAGEFAVAPIPVEPSEFAEVDTVMPAIGEVARHLVGEWESHAPDVVHCYGWTYGMAAQLAARRKPTPTVQTFHGLATTARRHCGPESNSETAIQLETLLVKNATVVTAACTDDLREVIRMGCPRARASVLPAGIDVEDFDVVGTCAPRDDARQRIVALARDFSPHQGFGQLIRVLPSLPAAELVLIATNAADDIDAQRALGLASHIGVAGRVHLVNAVDEREVAALLRSADVVACPAPYDAHAEAALRAMACGAAVVAPESGGPRDAVVSEVTGLLVPPGSAEALNRALRSLLSQKVLRQGMGLAGRARARSRYSWDRVATDAEVAYQAAVRVEGMATASR
ncbi:glycosyltransferase [Mycolicibacterium chubuense NBB4]|uniref:Glycosyltransferase n=1 Tax=Mycolicibacterium chubuense (strain NBB4) TaxID=710421 RepID=I4BJL0_MYCCN|nr:glycosyltransferase [Mycolicibacterium chubuense]AFM17467.1 glycosyltransferase [Mycolicibacterium chubuense NBB4]